MSPQSVFISYATEDREKVDVFLTALDKAGVNAWIDHRMIEKGQSIVELLNNAIMACPIALVFYSKNYAKKPWANEEQKALLYQFVESNREGLDSRSIVVVKLDDTNLPPLLAHRLWCGEGDPRGFASSIAEWIGLERHENNQEGSSIEGFPKKLNGLQLVQLATQVLGPIKESDTTQVPLEVNAIISGFGNIEVHCMPRPASDFLIDEIDTSLFCSNTHSRQIGALQKKLSVGGLGVFDESFRITLDQQIEIRNQIWFGSEHGQGMLEQLDALILDARRVC